MKPPISKTHDVSTVHFHVKDLEAFGKTLTDATRAAFPIDGVKSRYNEVHVLLIRWEDDLLGVSREIAELRDVFRDDYHYDTEEWQIPGRRSHNSLIKRMSDFLEAYENQKNLLVVYYAGHGKLNEDRQLVGFCHSTDDQPNIQWHGVQSMLEQAESDVLILLDCCAAASSTSDAGNGVTEVIAACGFETWAPAPSEHSFTRSLIDELRYWCGNLNSSVPMLHSRIVQNMKHWKPPRSSRSRNIELRKTPIHSLLTNQGQSRSIQLVPLPSQPSLPAELAVSPTEKPSSKSSGSHHVSPGIDDSIDSGDSESSSTQGESDTAKVLISLSLEKDQWLSPRAWIEWLENTPAKVQSGSVEGVYKSCSTLVLMTIPVAIWDMLPEDPAVNFVGFVKSQNLLRHDPVEEPFGQTSISSQPQITSTASTLPKQSTIEGGIMESSNSPSRSSPQFEQEQVAQTSSGEFETMLAPDNLGLFETPKMEDRLGVPSKSNTSWICGNCGETLNSLRFNQFCTNSSCGRRKDPYSREY